MREKKFTREAKILVRVSRQEKQLANRISYEKNESVSVFIRRLLKEENEQKQMKTQLKLIDEQRALLKETNELLSNARLRFGNLERKE
jgi:hypothetical protein